MLLNVRQGIPLGAVFRKVTSNVNSQAEIEQTGLGVLG
jgi:hypothetical protein